MASSSLGIACGRNSPNFIQKWCGVSLRPSHSVVMGRSMGRIAAAMLMEQERRMSMVERKREGGNDVVEGQERLDKWMRESVVDIVKNLREAPLLVQVYPKSGTTTMTSTENKVVVEDWSAMNERWENGETPVPEGVIFMEELSGDEMAEEGYGGERMTRVWGVVIQGKGVGCGPVCYLLKTSRVGSRPGLGMGICSTHFCSVKVKNFRETVQSQLKNCWLLQTQC